jgi:hypothetical protein
MRRLVDLRREDNETAVGWMEDDFHHFGVTVKHRDGIITDVRMVAARHPWTACPGAAEPLRALIGQPLVERASDIGRLIEMRLQCTHVFDLTGLVLAQAAQGRERLRYHAIISDREMQSDAGVSADRSRFGRGVATLLCNGQQVLQWAIDDSLITAPAEHAGHSLDQGFRAWTEAMPLLPAEHAFILRRAILVAGGRAIDHNDYPNADAMGVPALCHTFQPGTRETAWRVKDATRNYEQNASDMLIRLEMIP